MMYYMRPGEEEERENMRRQAKKDRHSPRREENAADSGNYQEVEGQSDGIL